MDQNSANSVILQIWHSSAFCEIMAFHEYRIELGKLNDSYYRDWKFALCIMLKWFGLWKYINETAILLKILRYVSCMITKVILLISIIVQCIDKKQYAHVQHTQSAKDAWDVLSQQYNNVSLYQQTLLRQNYHSVRYHCEVTRLNT